MVVTPAMTMAQRISCGLGRAPVPASGRRAGGTQPKLKWSTIRCASGQIAYAMANPNATMAKSRAQKRRRGIMDNRSSGNAAPAGPRSVRDEVHQIQRKTKQVTLPETPRLGQQTVSPVQAQTIDDG